MSVVFLKLLNMSFTATWLILAILLLRLILKKAPKWISCLLWALAAVRLVCPFSIESGLSLIPSPEPLPQTLLTGNSFQVNTGLGAVDTAINTYLSDSYYEGVTVPASYGNTVLTLLAILWLLGVLALLAYSVISYLRLRRRVRPALHLNWNIWICDCINAPFILGIFRPRIYLPSGISEDQRDYVLAHEKAHLERRDHWWKPLGFALVIVYWFHPLVWLSYTLLCRDIEMACDEKVIRDYSMEEKKSYSRTLLELSISGHPVGVCPLAFGEIGIKERIRSVLHYKKPAFWVMLVAVAACISAAVCFLTNPIIQRDTLKWAENLSAEDVASIELVVMPQNTDKQYKLFATEEIEAVVSLIRETRQTRLSYCRYPEALNGGVTRFYLRMKDGSEHTISNIGNTYLVIDGEYYNADYDWLESWPYTEGDSPLPEGFFSGQASERIDKWRPQNCIYLKASVLALADEYLLG